MNQPVPPAILAATSDQHVQAAMLLGSWLEGGWGPNFGVGDNGTSFGPFQMHIGGALTSSGLTPQQAENATLATKAMLPAYQNAVSQVPSSLWQTNPEQAAEQAAYLAERPAQDYFTARGSSTVNQGWSATSNVLGNPAQFTSGVGSVIAGAAGGLAGLIPGLSSLTGIGGFANLLASGAAKSYLERVGLVLLGGAFLIIGFIVLGMPAARSAAGVAAEVKSGQGTVKALSGSGAKARTADVERRQAIANRSLAIGEKNAETKRMRENRLTR